MQRLSRLPRALCVLLLAHSLTFAATKAVDLARDVRAARSVLLGEVSRVYSFYAEDGEIYSDVTLRVTSALKQPRETPATVTFRVPGGIVGDEGVYFTATPFFHENEPALVFLDETSTGELLATAKYEFDGRFLPELNLSASGLLDAIRAELEDSGEPARDFELDRARIFLRRQSNQQIVLNAGGPSCYALIGPKWRTMNLSYKLDTTIPTTMRTPIINAVASLNNAGVPLRMVLNSFSPNVVSYGPISAPGVLAQARVSFQPSTQTILGFTIVFNRAFQWSTNGATGTFDTEGVALHEFGHSVGLNHPEAPECNDQTMWFSVAPGDTTRRTFKTGDLAGLMFLYGPAPVAPPPPTFVPPPPPPSGPTGQAPPVPVFSSLAVTGTRVTNSTVTLQVTGTTFTEFLQFVIRGGGCPTSGCVIASSQLQNLTATTATARFTPRAGGTVRVNLRNTNAGVESDTSFTFSVSVSSTR